MQSTTVDSKPIAILSAIIIAAILFCKSSNTSVPQVGLGRPEVFAEGAAIGTPASSINCWATFKLGIRIATLSSPAVTLSGKPVALGKTKVKGPGQKLSIKA